MNLRRTLLGAAALTVGAVLSGCHNSQDTYTLEWGVVQTVDRDFTHCGADNPLPGCIEYRLELQGVASHGHTVRGWQPVGEAVYEDCNVGDQWREVAENGFVSNCLD